MNAKLTVILDIKRYLGGNSETECSHWLIFSVIMEYSKIQLNH